MNLEHFRRWRAANPDSSMSRYLSSLAKRPSGPLSLANREHQEDGVLYRLSIEDDDDGDPSYLGCWTRNADFPRTLKRAASARDGYDYFLPAVTVEETARCLSERGWSRAAAYAEALEQAYSCRDRLEAYGEQWNFVTVLVQAFRPCCDGAHWSEVSVFSLGGVESDAGDYFDEVAAQLYAKCRREAIDIGVAV